MPDNRVFKSRAMVRVEERIGRPLEEYLAEAYQAKTQAQIGEDLGLDRSTITRWMRELGIEPRFSGQHPPAEVVA